jgi:hypothetical protein
MMGKLEKDVEGVLIAYQRICLKKVNEGKYETLSM